MPKFLLRGYNSGGYRDRREIEFDGEIEKFYKPERSGEFPLMEELWYRYTYSDGRVVEDEGELLDALIREFSWNESFCATEIIREDAL